MRARRRVDSRASRGRPPDRRTRSRHPRSRPPAPGRALSRRTARRLRLRLRPRRPAHPQERRRVRVRAHHAPHGRKRHVCCRCGPTYRCCETRSRRCCSGRASRPRTAGGTGRSRGFATRASSTRFSPRRSSSRSGFRLSRRAETGLRAALAFLAFFSTFRYGRPFLTNAPEVFWLFLPFALLLLGRPALAGSRILAPFLVGASIGLALLYKSFALVVPAGLALAWWHLRFRDGRLAAFLAKDAWRIVFAIDDRPRDVRLLVRPRPGPRQRVAGLRASGERGQVRPAGRLSSRASSGARRASGAWPSAIR